MYMYNDFFILVLYTTFVTIATLLIRCFALFDPIRDLSLLSFWGLLL